MRISTPLAVILGMILFAIAVVISTYVWDGIVQAPFALKSTFGSWVEYLKSPRQY